MEIRKLLGSYVMFYRSNVGTGHCAFRRLDAQTYPEAITEALGAAFGLRRLHIQ